jgi:hypothetical protein
MKQLSVISYRLSNCGYRKFYFMAFVFLLTVHCSLFTVRAQDEDPPNAAAPPVKALSKDEKTALESQPDLKIHTKLAIDLMETRLKKAEELNMQEAFNTMFTELGGFQALMDDTIKFLNKNDNGRGKTLDNFKRFEMALRSFTPRIETLRRESPERFGYYVRRLLRTVRDTRAKAVEPFFGETVVPNND